MTPAALESSLRDGAHALGLSLSDAQVAQLLAYLALLQKWGRVYNLTAVREPAEMLTHHLLDSLAVIPPLRRHAEALGQPALRVLDVGSGAGLPGVVIAVCCPDMAVTCVDTVAKKAAFVQQVAVQDFPSCKAKMARRLILSLCVIFNNSISKTNNRHNNCSTHRDKQENIGAICHLPADQFMWAPYCAFCFC